MIVALSFAAAKQADKLATLLGEPYGTLILTLSVALIEVTLIAAVMLGPGQHPSIARDSIMSVSMIILNLVVGLALVVSHGAGSANPGGTKTYLALLVIFVFTTFALPNLLGNGGQFPRILGWGAAVVISGGYAFFLYRQMGPSRTRYQELQSGARNADRAQVGMGTGTTRSRTVKSSVLLVVLLALVIVLADSMADLMDSAFSMVDAPPALAGLVIATVVFLPETITTLKAAKAGEMQRVSNLCHGALLSTMGITVPVVVAVGLVSGTPVVFAEGRANLTLFVATFALTYFSFGRGRNERRLGVLHLGLFLLYVVLLLTQG